MNTVRHAAHEGAMYAALAGLLAIAVLAAGQTADIVVRLGNLLL